jgi:hypothetical protein
MQTAQARQPLAATVDHTMKMKLQILKISVVILFFGCTNSNDKKSVKQKETADNVNKMEDADGPPFDKECLCSFNNFGVKKKDGNELNYYYSGQGWNSNYTSCTWTWGEIINNEFPDDTNIKVVKYHLLDLTEFNIPREINDYGNDSIKKYVIAIYTVDNKKGTEKCVFDPFKTGKYPKPKQWIE